MIRRLRTTVRCTIVGDSPGGILRGFLPAAFLATAVLTAAAPTASAQDGSWTLVGWNDLGMHCMDADYSVLSILPPYNTIHAHLISPSGDLVTNPAGITVTYEGVADPAGSINVSSINKTNFWDWVLDLFGASPAPDEGLAGSDMPGPVNTPQPMHFDSPFHWFTAEGIPLTPYDDGGDKNYYPMMKLVARDASGTILATTRIVLPVSDEMTCISCHGSGSGPDAMPSGGWINDPDPELDYRLNVLLLHDDLQAGDPTYAAALAAAGYNSGGLYATVTSDGTPILCDACHASNALPGTGMGGISPLTEAVHALHAGVTDPNNGMTLDESANRTACYTCHPGSETRCLRGAMGNAVASDGSLAIQCQNCHGNMSRVGAADREGWFDEPTCQNCHTGTAADNNGEIRYTSVFDEFGEPRVAVNHTFATNPDTPLPGVSLYRFSSGHGGLQCEACHGSTHAIYPSSHLNDNLQNIDQQGHAGTLADCSSCHAQQPETVSGGPHGMHPVGNFWVDHHTSAAEHNPGQCQACHGVDYRGTVLSRALGNRVVGTEWGTKNFWQGFQIGCYTCHNGPRDDERNSNRAPVVSNVSAATFEEVPVDIQLSATDADGDTLSLRIVSQPANGTVGLSGTVATFYPFPGFTGDDTFTYAAWDGSTNSNLATGAVNVSGGGSSCSITCSATADPTGLVDQPASFSGSATLTDCLDDPTFEWDFGDGDTASGADVTHAYSAPGTYSWTLTVTADGESCSRTGAIEIVAAPECSISCEATVDATGLVGEPAAFSGTATLSDCLDDPSYEWSFGDGSTASGADVTHAYGAPGSYSWTLTVTADGVTCTQTGTIEIAPSPSDCELSCSAEVNNSGRVGRRIEFHGASESNNCDGPTVYEWTFGDGSPAVEGQEVEHAYSQSGEFTWRLRVIRDGTVCEKTGTITIRGRRSSVTSSGRAD
jgi:PKD repeat protein